MKSALDSLYLVSHFGRLCERKRSCILSFIVVNEKFSNLKEISAHAAFLVFAYVCDCLNLINISTF